MFQCMMAGPGALEGADVPPPVVGGETLARLWLLSDGFQRSAVSTVHIGGG